MENNLVPNHIAIICDGNRRWAQQHKLEVFKGHEYAVNKVFEPLVDRAIERGVKYLTFWIFSTENWQRDPQEVEYLMKLFRVFFDEQVARLGSKGVRVQMIGRKQDFPEDIQQRIDKGIADTQHNDTITITLAMSYGGRDEVLRAVQAVAREVVAGQLQPTEITEAVITSHLDTSKAGIPDPDFIIRTSGEQRLSGFMSWQHQYAEFWFPEFNFPEFTPKRLDEAIEVFTHRQRRFGK